MQVETSQVRAGLCWREVKVRNMKLGAQQWGSLKARSEHLDPVPPFPPSSCFGVNGTCFLVPSMGDLTAQFSQPPMEVGCPPLTRLTERAEAESRTCPSFPTLRPASSYRMRALRSQPDFAFLSLSLSTQIGPSIIPILHANWGSDALGNSSNG